MGERNHRERGRGSPQLKLCADDKGRGQEEEGLLENASLSLTYPNHLLILGRVKKEGGKGGGGKKKRRENVYRPILFYFNCFR